MRRLFLSVRALLAGALVLCSGTLGWASTTYSVSLNPNNFGTVNQNNVPAQGPGTAGANSCVPTAVANGIQYLQSVYSAHYGANTLIPVSSSTQDVAIDLANNWMNTTNASGTSGTSWIDDKARYFESKAPNKTIYSAQYSGYGGTANWVALNNPTFSFLYNALLVGAEAEVGVLPLTSGIGHALTLTSLNWVDANDDGRIQSSEGATFGYVDPAGGATGSASLFQTSAGGVMKSDYSGGYQIVLDAVATPVPEPTGVALFALFACGAMARRRAA